MRRSIILSFSLLILIFLGSFLIEGKVLAVYYEVSGGSVRGLYHMENSADSSGYGNTLTANNVSNVSALFNDGYRLVGSNSSLTASFPATSTPFGISLWFNLNSGGATNSYLFDFGSNQGQLQFYNGGSGTNLHAYYCGVNSPGAAAINSAASGWHNVIVNYHTNDTFELYLDGNTTPDLTGTCPSAVFNHFTIGSFGGGTGNVLGGDMDDFVFRNAAFSNSDITGIWNGGVGREVCPESGCVFSLTPTTLSGGVEGDFYSATISASGTAPGPFTWSVASGTLPLGLSLDTGATGASTTISGTPTINDTYQFSIYATNGTSSAIQSYTLTIDQASDTLPMWELSTSSVKGLYHFEGTSDSSGYGHTLTANNTSRYPAILDDGYRLVGSNSSLTASFPATSTPFGISLWFNLNSGGATNSYLFDFGSNQGQLQFYNGGSGTNLHAYYCGVNSPGAAAINSAASGWHNVIVNYHTNDTFELYLDGNTTPDLTGTCPSAVFNHFTIGSFGGGTGNVLGGDMDDFVFRNAAFSNSDITGIWNGGVGREVCVTAGCGETASSTNFYAKIQNTGTLNLCQDPDTSSPILKTLPADWVVYVTSTVSATGTAIVNDSYRWFNVIDKTDGVTGWMAATSSGAQYISSYDGSSQSTFEDMASTTLDDEPSRAAKIKEAVDWYYTNTSSTGSLYSSDGLSSVFSSSSPSTSYPEDLVFPIAAGEDGSTDFNNETVTFDYGHGIMQLTNRPTSSDVFYLQTLLNMDLGLSVATSGHFGSATESAVQSFQIKYSTSSVVTAVCNPLPTSGTPGTTGFGSVGYCTRAMLNSVLSSWATSTIPTSTFHFEERLSTTQNEDDLTSPDATSTGILSGLRIPPCDNRQDPSSVNYMKLCYEPLSSSTDIKSYVPQPNYSNQTFKYYGNTSQSIYANIKDGLDILKQKYDTCLPGGSGFCTPSTSTIMRDGETFTYNDRLDLLATWGYNGFSSTTYLGDIANILANIHSYFSAIPNPATSTGSWYNKLKVAQKYKFDFETLSPVTVSITDSKGRATGLVNGKVQAQIPDSAYDPDTHAGTVLFPDDTYTFKLVGTANDTYGFIVNSNDGSATTTVYQALNIPIKNGAIHSYTIDFAKLKLGEPGVTVKIDDNGDGKIDRTITDIGTVSFEGPQKFTAPSFPVAPPKPKSAPPALRIFQVQPTIPTSTMDFASSTQVSTSTFSATSSLENFTSTIEIDSSTIQINSSTENNE